MLRSIPRNRYGQNRFIGPRIDAGVVDEQVYGLIGQRLRQALDLDMIGDIKRMLFYQLGILSRQFVERI